MKGSLTRFALVLVAAMVASASIAVVPAQQALATSHSTDVPPSGIALAMSLPGPASKTSARAQLAHASRQRLSEDPVALKRLKAAASDRAAATHNGLKPTAHARAAAPRTNVYLGNNMPGLGAGGCCTPSDSTGDRGPANFVEMVNSEIGVYPPACGPCGPAGTADLATFAGIPCLGFDPQIAWDAQGGRWLYAMLADVPAAGKSCAGPFAYELLAFGWSRTSDPTDLVNGWCRYAINTGSYLHDYPKLGHDNNFISIGANVFTNFGNAGSTFVSAIIWAISKPARGLTSCVLPSKVTYFGGLSNSVLVNSDGTRAFTPVPAETTDSYGYGYVVAAHNVLGGPSNKVMVWHLSSKAGSAVLSRDGDVGVASYGVPPPVPQETTTTSCSTAGNCLDSLDGRLTQAIAHFDPDAGRETVWTQHAVTDAAVGTLSVERWYELIPGGAAPRQAGNVGDPSRNIFNGAVSPSMAGNEAVIFYNAGSTPSSFGRVTYEAQSRNSLNPLGTFSNALVIQSSFGDDTDFSCGINQPSDPTAPCRWGDYSAARPDPQSTNAVWGVGMLNSAAMGSAPGWMTQFAAVTPGCATATISGGPSSRNNYSFNVGVGSNDCPNPEFEFWLRYPNGTWVLKQSFSPNSTWTWDSTSAPLGNYVVHVWANQVGDSTASLEAFGEIAFTLTKPAPCATAGIGPLNPLQPAGSMVGFVATSTGCQAPVYEYWFQDQAGTWRLGRPFSADPSWFWDTTGLAPGSYNIHVWANEQGDSTASFEAYTSAVATLTGCTSAAINPPTATQRVGTMVGLTASSGGGCPNPQYEFWVGYPNGTWVVKQGWGGATFTWDTSGLAPGTYSVHVWANQIGASTATWEAIGSSTITLTP